MYTNYTATPVFKKRIGKGVLKLTQGVLKEIKMRQEKNSKIHMPWTIDSYF